MTSSARGGDPGRHASVGSGDRGDPAGWVRAAV